MMYISDILTYSDLHREDQSLTYPSKPFQHPCEAGIATLDDVRGSLYRKLVLPERLWCF